MEDSWFSGHYLGDLSLGWRSQTQDFEHRGAPIGTMNLLSSIEKPAAAPTREFFPVLPQFIGGGEGVHRSEAETAQMTIFYGGKVLVFNDIPVEKASEIMTIATRPNHPTAATPLPYMAPSPAESTNNNNNNILAVPQIVPNFDLLLHYPPQPPLGADLPMARKNSLARFLEKRKNRRRIAAKTPYYQAESNNKGINGEEAWLGLGTQFPFQMERH